MAEKKISHGSVEKKNILTDNGVTCDYSYYSESHKIWMPLSIGTVDSEHSNICYGKRISHTNGGEVCLWRPLQDGDINSFDGSTWSSEIKGWKPRDRPFRPGECYEFEGIKINADGTEVKDRQVWTYDSSIGHRHNVKNMGEGESFATGSCRPIKGRDFYHTIPLPDAYIDAFYLIDGLWRVDPQFSLPAGDGYSTWGENAAGATIPQEGTFCPNNAIVFSKKFDVSEETGKIGDTSGEAMFRVPVMYQQILIAQAKDGKQVFRDRDAILTASTSGTEGGQTPALGRIIYVPTVIDNFKPGNDASQKRANVLTMLIVDNDMGEFLQEFAWDAFRDLFKKTANDVPWPNTAKILAEEKYQASKGISFLSSVKSSRRKILGALCSGDGKEFTEGIKDISRYLAPVYKKPKPGKEDLVEHHIDIVPVYGARKDLADVLLATAHTLYTRGDASPLSAEELLKTLVGYAFSVYHTQESLRKFHLSAREAFESVKVGTTWGAVAGVAAGGILPGYIDTGHPFYEAAAAAALGFMVAGALTARRHQFTAGIPDVASESRENAKLIERRKDGSWSISHHLKFEEKTTPTSPEEAAGRKRGFRSKVIGYIFPPLGIKESRAQLLYGIKGMMYCGTGGDEGKDNIDAMYRHTRAVSIAAGAVLSAITGGTTKLLLEGNIEWAISAGAMAGAVWLAQRIPINVLDGVSTQGRGISEHLGRSLERPSTTNVDALRKGEVVLDSRAGLYR